jgi:hypothetical protein
MVLRKRKADQGDHYPDGAGFTNAVRRPAQ